MRGPEGFAHGRYEGLAAGRQHILDIAREAASLTIPHLMVPQGHTATSDLPKPYQSLGSRGVRNLASKLLLTLFPPHTPFFKYSIDDLAAEEIEQEGGPESRGQIEALLSIRERVIMKEVEASFFRTAAFEAFRQLLVSGNVCIHVPEEDHAQIHRLDTYVVKRDPEGTVLEAVIKQAFAPSSLEERAQALVTQEKPSGDKTHEESVDLFTYIRRTNKGKYELWQEVCGKQIPGTKSVYKAERMPYLFLRLTKIDGEDYGRGYCEELLGDLVSFEGLSQALLEGATIMSRCVTLVAPGSSTHAHDIASAENGAVVAGHPDDVAMLQAEKRADFSVVQSQAQEITQRLQFAFLLNTAIQRNGERVTAEEIRYMAQELEDGLGGMYSLLAQEFQLPIVKLFEARAERNRQMSKLPEDLVSPAIVTGIDALGRGHDLRNMDAFLVGLGEQFGPEVLGRYINLSEAIRRRGVALGIDMADLVRTDEEVAQAEQQAQMEALAQNLGPNAIQAMAQLQGKQMDNETKENIEAAKMENQ